MSRMFGRRKMQGPTLEHTSYLDTREDWDAKIRNTDSARKSDRKLIYVLLAGLSVSGGGNVYQASENKVQLIHVLHDQAGRAINVAAASGSGVLPTQQELQAALKDWVCDLREVSIDAWHQRQAVFRVYDLVDGSSQASSDLNAWYVSHRPFDRAQTETVEVPFDSVTAMPPTSATIGPNGMQTWDITWTETTVSRQDQIRIPQIHHGKITFYLRQMSDTNKISRNPDGIHIIATSGFTE